jgi:4-hydroxythreonine-4-phosphate dehydrogenase
LISDAASSARAHPLAVIVADDLTGAADTCVTFVSCGLSGSVLLDRPASHDRLTTDVLAVSTDTRSAPPMIAMTRVHAVAERYAREYQPAIWFKKIDSTLRGHAGAEIAACLEAWDARLAIITPAFPAMGRRVSGGMLRVTGRGALPSIDVATRLAMQGLDCTTVSIPVGGMAIHEVAGAMRSAHDAGARAIVCDAESDEELDTIVAAALTLAEPGQRPVAWIGSAGLAGALARRLAGQRMEPRVVAAPAAGSVLFVIGSHHPVTLEQKRCLMRNNGSEPVIRAAVAQLDTIRFHASAGDHLLIEVPAAATEAAIGRFVQAIGDLPLRGLVLSGGGTAARICRHLTAGEIRLAGEVSRGIPFGSLAAPAAASATESLTARWPVVLKSGGFGADEALLHVLTFLTTARTDGLTAHDG